MPRFSTRGPVRDRLKKQSEKEAAAVGVEGSNPFAGSNFQSERATVSATTSAGAELTSAVSNISANREVLHRSRLD